MHGQNHANTHLFRVSGTEWKQDRGKQWLNVFVTESQKLIAAYLHSQARRSLLNSGSHVVIKDIVMKGRRYCSISFGHERTFMSFATLTPVPKLCFCTLKEETTTKEVVRVMLPDNPRHTINIKITLKCQMNVPSQMCLCPQITPSSG